MVLKDLPPTPKGRHYELRGQALREFAGLRSDEEPLDPFSLARYANLMVVSLDQISGLSPQTLAHLLGSGQNDWSGGAASRNLPNGQRIIILNPTHGPKRHMATLMEEISHVFLGHKPSRLALEKKNKDGKVVARDYNQAIEEEAYSSGAAALVPYTSLKRMVKRGKTAREIADHFGVSRALVEFRMKVNRLWDLYSKSIFSGEDG
jgi:hypothetical protein